MGNMLIYDYFSFTSKIHSPEGLIELLGLKEVTWEVVKGAHGYKDRLYYESISIHYNGGDDMGVWVEMTGQGCRAFETYGHGDYELIFDYIVHGDLHVTRLDVAYDDQKGILDIDRLCEDTIAGMYVSRFNDWQVIRGSKGSSVTHGSMSSELFIRVYDKAVERGYKDGRHWIRVELQMRRDRASSFLGLGYDLGKRFAGVLVNYLRYVEPDLDSNKWRWPLVFYWADLIGDACGLSVYEKPGVDYNILKLEDYVIRQAGNAIDTYIDICGVDKFLQDLRERKTLRNPKYEALKKKHGRK
jgi:phage replication initiation protein